MRLQEKYQKEIIPQLQKKLGLKNKMALPKISKVVINFGFGKMIEGKTSSEREKTVSHLSQELALITGQKPVLRKAKKSIAAFRLRQGSPVGLTVTLRGKKMYQFLEKIIFVVLPRKRDFRGIPLTSITEQGNLTIGFKEYTPFPEVKLEKEKLLFGLEMSVVLKQADREKAIELFKALQFPLQKQTING